LTLPFCCAAIAGNRSENEIPRVLIERRALVIFVSAPLISCASEIYEKALGISPFRTARAGTKTPKKTLTRDAERRLSLRFDR